MYELLRRSPERPWASQPERLDDTPDRGDAKPLILPMQENRSHLSQEARVCFSVIGLLSMGILTLSNMRHRKLQRFRSNTWKAIALCAAVRLADAAFGLGFVEPTQSLAAQEITACPVQQESRS